MYVYGASNGEILSIHSDTVSRWGLKRKARARYEDAYLSHPRSVSEVRNK